VRNAVEGGERKKNSALRSIRSSLLLLERMNEGPSASPASELEQRAEVCRTLRNLRRGCGIGRKRRARSLLNRIRPVERTE